MQENKPILIVGLGNPGEKYKNTRHNVGFIAVQYFVSNDEVWKKEKNALTVHKQFDGKNVIFALPQTFMNDSGRSVEALMNFYKIPLENLIVIHDDMDLPIGDMRVKCGGGSAGHNGIKSIDSAVGKDYTRIRIGIDHPRRLNLLLDPADWVLGEFSKEQLVKIMSVVKNLNILEH